MSWVILIVSGVLEAVWATALGTSEGFSRRRYRGLAHRRLRHDHRRRAVLARAAAAHPRPRRVRRRTHARRSRL